MDSNNHEIRPKKYDEKSLEKLENKIVFNNDARNIFIFKKTEKIVSALYLITNLIKDSEPLKWDIRTAALELLALTTSFQNTETNNKKYLVTNSAGIITRLGSLVRIGYLSQHISEMNYTILLQEISLILDTINEYAEDSLPRSGIVLSQDFFATPQLPIVQNTATQRYPASNNFGKGHVSDNKGQKDINASAIDKDDKKESRRGTILELLKDGRVLGIKDFSKHIKDCSEKTIQRELLALVHDGVLNKKGERRWSLYSLANR